MIEKLSQRVQYNKGGPGRWYWDFRDKQALKHISREEKLILDLGCGEGLTLEKMARDFKDIKFLGVDADPENVAICKKYDLSVEQGDAYSLNFPENNFDVVSFLEVIEHLDYPQKAIGEIRRVLKPGGKLIIIFPNDFIFKLSRIITLKFKEAAYNPGHKKQWRHELIKRFLKENGFEVVYSRNLPFYFWNLSLHGIVVAKKLSRI